MRGIAAIVLSLVAASAASGQVSVTIDGPERVAPGDLAIFRAKTSGPNVGQHAWALVGTDRQLFVDSSGRSACFASGTPGVYHVALAVAGDGPSDRPDTDQPTNAVGLATHTLIVGTPGPVPPPVPPGPGPTPPPPVPPVPPTPPVPSRFGLEADAVTWAKLVQLDPFAKKQRLEKLAAAFAQVAPSAAGLTPATFLASAAAANKEALGPDAPAFAPMNTAFAAKMTELRRAGKLAQMADFAAAWEEFARGLAQAAAAITL